MPISQHTGTLILCFDHCDEVIVSLVTVEDEFKGEQQRDYFDQIQKSMFSVGIKFAYSYDNSGSQHARHIVTDAGWKISLDRGLIYFSRTI